MTVIVTLRREASTDQGTYGVLAVPGGLVLQTLELPWRDNRRQVSCIPAGRYACAITQSPKFGRVYLLQGVPGRSEILIHAGNVAGDVSRGLRSDVQGCILLGRSRGELRGQRAVINSRVAVDEFMAELHGAPFTLEILAP